MYNCFIIKLKLFIIIQNLKTLYNVIKLSNVPWLMSYYPTNFHIIQNFNNMHGG